MAESVITAALSALAEKLADWPALAGVAIERERLAPVQTRPAIVITMGEAQSAALFTGRCDIAMEVTLECFHEAAPGETEADAHDAALALAMAAQAAVADDPTLGGAADDTEAQTVAVELFGGDPVAARADLGLTIAIGHAVTDPFTRA